MIGQAVLAAGAGFLLGSIPWGVILLRLAGGPDPRTVGSGNIGATNVVRAGGKPLGAATLLLDALKGAAACWLFGATTVPAAVAGGAAILGHCFTPWLRFHGGKGVATFLGVAAVVAWPWAPIAFFATWLACFALTRISAVAGVTACLVGAVTAGYLAATAGGPGRIAAAVALSVGAAVVVLRHRSNFEKLAAERRARQSGEVRS